MNTVTIRKTGDRYVAQFRFDYETKDRVKEAGFRFDGAAKHWWTSDPVIARKFEPAIEPEVSKTNGSHAPTAPVPTANGLEYLPFQKAGIEWLKGRENALLADEMGLGKTIQVIGLINADVSIKRVLIVCPASLKLNWKAELMKWRPGSITSINVIDPWTDWLETDVVIINYEQVEKHRREIDAASWDLLVCDESHYLKSSKAKRTQMVVGYWHADPAQRIYPIKAKQRVFLTGTPVLNRPKELWTTVRALDRKNLGNDWLGFHTRYCAGYKDRFGWQIDGASNLDELNERLRSGIMLRRKKADVLPELPPKRRQVILLEPVTTGAKEALEAERELGEVAAKIEAMRTEVEALSKDQADKKYKEAVQKLASYEAVAFSETSRVRKRTALAKLPMARDHLLNILESEQKIVVFAHHHDVIDQLVEWLGDYGAVTFDGRVADTAKRQAAVDAFQNDPKVRVIIGSIGAMGSGWTLHAASYVAFAELDWVPGNLNQAEDRLHRIGQKESILIQHLMLNGSFDAKMVKAVMHKQAVIERAVG